MGSCTYSSEMSRSSGRGAYSIDFGLVHVATSVGGFDDAHAIAHAKVRYAAVAPNADRRREETWSIDRSSARRDDECATSSIDDSRVTCRGRYASGVGSVFVAMPVAGVVGASVRCFAFAPKAERTREETCARASITDSMVASRRKLEQVRKKARRNLGRYEGVVAGLAKKSAHDIDPSGDNVVLRCRSLAAGW